MKIFSKWAGSDKKSLCPCPSGPFVRKNENLSECPKKLSVRMSEKFSDVRLSEPSVRKEGSKFGRPSVCPKRFFRTSENVRSEISDGRTDKICPFDTFSPKRSNLTFEMNLMNNEQLFLQLTNCIEICLK